MYKNKNNEETFIVRSKMENIFQSTIDQRNKKHKMTMCSMNLFSVQMKNSSNFEKENEKKKMLKQSIVLVFVFRVLFSTQ